jgi:acetolactate synthase-1/2/3 large subunit
MRVADVIARLLVDHGITDVFMLTGGGAMHLNDALGRQSSLVKTFTHHEQAAAIAAEAYCRLSNRPAALNVTTGPGGVNALNGVYGAYVDSIAMVVISGQVKRETCMTNFPMPLRQLGDQEVDIVSMASGITKYAVLLNDPADVRKVVEKAIYLCKRGRPGPVWIDVPIDVQGAPVDFDALETFKPEENDRQNEADNTHAEMGILTGDALASEVGAIIGEICAAERPVILAGAGVRLSDQHSEFLKFVEKFGAPVVTGWNAHDALANEHPLYAGRPGSVGDRAGNFAVQTADYVLVLGSRLNIRQISYNWQSFAKNGKVVMVDIDRAELEKPTLSLHRAVHADLRDFLKLGNEMPLPEDDKKIERAAFLARCKGRSKQYPVVLPEYFAKSEPVNPYVFVKCLFDQLVEGDIVVSGDGTACVTVFQAAELKDGQRLFTNSGCASMGYDLPAAIGACKAAPGRRIICLAGDGSIMMNLQELQTIAGGNLPVKIFILNNDGYHSIRQSQQNHFPDNIVGCGPDSGLSFPNFSKLADGFEISSNKASSHDELPAAISVALESEGPFICEVMLDKEQEFAPKMTSRKLPDGRMLSSDLEDMSPFLSRDELEEAMQIGQVS